VVLQGPVDSVPVGTPVITWEIMQVRLYRSSTWQLGARSLSAGETTQPVAGPLLPGGSCLPGRTPWECPLFRLGPLPVSLSRFALRWSAPSGRLRVRECGESWMTASSRSWHSGITRPDGHDAATPRLRDPATPRPS
jgi:hypothetical protein